MITRAIPVPQPDADAILYEGQDYLEVRWSTGHRGLHFIYATRHPSCRAGIPLPRGGLVGVVNIVDCVALPGGGSLLQLGYASSIAFITCGGRPCSWQLTPNLVARANEHLREAVDVG